MRRILLGLLLVTAACGDNTGATTHQDPPADCRSAFGEGPVDCGPGADITSVRVDAAGPIVLTIELAEPPRFDADLQWLVEFAISDLACGLTNTASTGSGFEGSDVLGPYGYRLLTNEDAPPGACDGDLDGTTATLTFNIQKPLGPWDISGGTQHVEIANLEDDGSSDDVVIDVASE